MSPVTVKDIIGSYALSTLNGNEAPNVVLQLSEGEEGFVSIHAKVANSMNGRGKLENGVLKAMLMSTRMMGPPPLMAVENALNAGFDKGFTVSVSNGELTLTNEGTVLVYKKQ